MGADAFDSAAKAFDVRRTLSRELEQRTNRNIRALLRKRGMSDTDLGEAIGLSQAAISRRFVCLSRWEAEDLESVARVLETTVERLVGTHQ